MNGVGFNKVNKVIHNITGLDAYICDIEPVEPSIKPYGHNGGVNFSVVLPNDAFTKFIIRYFDNDENYSVEVSKYNKFNLGYESAVVNELGLHTLFKAVYEEISILNNMLLDKLDFTLSKSADLDLQDLKDLDNNY